MTHPDTNSVRWCEACGGRREFRAGKKPVEEPEAKAAEQPRAWQGADERRDMDPLEDGSWPAKWKKLRRDDEWGALAFSAKVQAGDPLTIERATESTTSRRTVDKVLWSGDGQALCSLRPGEVG